MSHICLNIWISTLFESSLRSPIVHSKAFSNTVKKAHNTLTKEKLGYVENSLPYNISAIPSMSKSLLLPVCVCQEVLFKRKHKIYSRKICKFCFKPFFPYFQIWSNNNI